MRRLLIVVPLLAVAAIGVIAAIASANSPTRTTASPSIGLHRTALGRYLVDDRGRALYLFEADKPNRSACRGACLSVWPAYTATRTPKAARGISARRIGTIAAAGGRRQITYGGHPLYRYVGDRKPGETTGQGLDQFGAGWYVVAASGRKIDRG